MGDLNGTIYTEFESAIQFSSSPTVFEKINFDRHLTANFVNPLPEHQNVNKIPVVGMTNIYLPIYYRPNSASDKFVKAMDRNSDSFLYLKEKLSFVS